MYRRRALIAAPTGRRKTTFKIAKKIAKLINWTIAVPSRERNIRALLTGQVRHDRRHVGDDQQQVEREPERDDRERFQHADAQEQEGEDVRSRFGLTRDRLDRLRCDQARAPRRPEGEAEDDQAEGQDRWGGYQTLGSQVLAFL